MVRAQAAASQAAHAARDGRRVDPRALRPLVLCDPRHRVRHRRDELAGEFSDTDRKMERYTRAIASIENLLSQWDSTGEVERASVTAIANLVVTGESIIANERLAWQSTATSRDDEAGAAEGESSSAEAEAGPGKGGRKASRVSPGSG